MNVQTIIIPEDVALEKLRAYRGVVVENRRKQDADFRRLYRAASTGKPILDVAAALKQTGLSEKGHPKLALARATWLNCHFRPFSGMFSEERWPRRSSKGCIHYPEGTYLYENGAKPRDLVVPVPFIPPNCRPSDSLEKYHILFEVENWTEYPADPFLLRHISGWLFVVVAEWELTDLERSLLSNFS